MQQSLRSDRGPSATRKAVRHLNKVSLKTGRGHHAKLTGFGRIQVAIPPGSP